MVDKLNITKWYYYNHINNYYNKNEVKHQRGKHTDYLRNVCGFSMRSLQTVQLWYLKINRMRFCELIKIIF